MLPYLHRCLGQLVLQGRHTVSHSRLLPPLPNHRLCQLYGDLPDASATCIVHHTSLTKDGYGQLFCSRDYVERKGFIPAHNLSTPPHCTLIKLTTPAQHP